MNYRVPFVNYPLQYRKIKNEILLNPLGIKNKNNVQIATPERAICDKLYLDGVEYFDNLRNIDWAFMGELNTQVYGKNKVISDFTGQNTR